MRESVTAGWTSTDSWSAVENQNEKTRRPNKDGVCQISSSLQKAA
jgi:hypothetical protein